MKNRILFNILLVSLFLPTTTFAQSLEVSSPDSDHTEKNSPHPEMLEYHCAHGDNESYSCTIDGNTINVVKLTRWLHQHTFESTIGYGYFVVPSGLEIYPYGITLSAIYLYSVNEYYQVGGGVTMHTILLIPSIHIENRFRFPITNYMAWYLSVPFKISHYLNGTLAVPGVRTGFQFMITQTENYGLGMVVNGGIDILLSKEGLYYLKYSDSTYSPIVPSFSTGFLMTF